MTSDELNAVLAARTPGEWYVEPGEKLGDFSTVWGQQGTPPDFEDGWAIPLAAKALPTNARAIVVAVNLAPHWQRVAEAARDIADRSPTDVDGEGLGGEWCHWCERQTDGANRPRHEEWCDFAALQTALAALDAAREAL